MESMHLGPQSMTGHIDTPSSQSNTGIERLLLLLLVVAGLFGLLYFPSRLFVPGDPAATVRNTLASDWLFRLGPISDLVGEVLFLSAGIALYRLLISARERPSRLPLILFIAGIPILCLNLLSELGPLLLLSGARYLTMFEPARVSSVVMAVYTVRDYGTPIAGVLWALWLLPLAFLVFNLRYFPKALGVLLVIACFTLLAHNLVTLVLPSYGGLVSVVAVTAELCELPFILGSLSKGVNLT